MRKCEEAQVALIELVFGELDDAAEMRLSQHLLACPACRSEEKRLLDLRDAARGGEVKPGAEFRARIEASLTRPRIRSAAVVLGRPVPAYVAVVAGVIGALLVAALPPRHEPRVKPVREASRPVGVVIGGGQMPFVVADSYDTRVMPASPGKGMRESSASRSRSQDSL